MNKVFGIAALVIAGSIFYYYVIFLPKQSTQPQADINAIRNAIAPPNDSTRQNDSSALPPGQIRLYPKKLKEPFVVDGVEYTVESGTNLGNQLSSGNSPFSLFGGPNESYEKTEGSFIQIKMSVKNVGSQETNFFNLFYVLQDSLKRQFKADKSYLAKVDGYTEFGTPSIESIKPGFSRKFFSIFEVAPDSKGFWLIIGNGKDQNFYVPIGL